MDHLLAAVGALEDAFPVLAPTLSLPRAAIYSAVRSLSKASPSVETCAASSTLTAVRAYHGNRTIPKAYVARTHLAQPQPPTIGQ
jgi:hypothetical protein